MEEFITYYNSFENKKHVLHEKFPQLGAIDGLFIKLQREYIAQLEFSDIYLEDVSTRDDNYIPGSVFTSFSFPKCTFDTDDCPNFKLNGCDVAYKECILDAHDNWLGGQTPNGEFTGLMGCWGSEFVFVEIDFTQQCLFNLFGELVCFNDPPNVVGIQGIVHLLVGGGGPGAGDGSTFDCVSRLFSSYELDVCKSCDTQMEIECDCQ